MATCNNRVSEDIWWWNSLLQCSVRWEQCDCVFQGTVAFPEPIAFPPALIWGFALFLALKEPIQPDAITVAAPGGEANIYCNFSLSMDVLQVTWQKRNGISLQNLQPNTRAEANRIISEEGVFH